MKTRSPARRLRPEIDAVFERVERAGGEPRLSGSGPTVYSLLDDAELGSALATALRADGMRVTLTRTRIAPTSIETIEEE